MATCDETPGIQPSEVPRAKKPYEPPEITEWGTITALTRGLAGAPGDDAFTGTAT